MRWLIVLMLVAAQGWAEGIEGLWVFQGPGPETVYRFMQVGDEVMASVVLREGAGPDTLLFCQNPQFNRRPLLNRPWIWGLKSSGENRWTGGLAVDLRNDLGSLFYCEAVLTASGSLVLTGVAGLAESDRILVFSRWEPAPDGPFLPEGNLLADLWVRPPDPPRPRPLLDPTADALVGGFVYYGLAVILVALTVLSLMGGHP